MRKIVAIPMLPLPDRTRFDDIPSVMQLAVTNAPKGCFEDGLFSFDIITSSRPRGGHSLLLVAATETMQTHLSMTLQLARIDDSPAQFCRVPNAKSLHDAIGYMNAAGIHFATWQEICETGYSYSLLLAQSEPAVRALLRELGSARPDLN